MFGVLLIVSFFPARPTFLFIFLPPHVVVAGFTRLPPTSAASPLPTLTRHCGGERGELHYSIPERAQAEGIFLAQQLAANTYVRSKVLRNESGIVFKGFHPGVWAGGKAGDAI